MDIVAVYVASKAWTLRRNLVLVEGTQDEAVFGLADRLSTAAGKPILGNDISVVAAGRRDRGGTYGVARELITLRSMIPMVLDRNGRQMYRVVALVDNDHAGRQIINDVVKMDRSAAEFRDIVTMRPSSPVFTSSDVSVRRREYDNANRTYANLNWEMEDALSPRLLQLLDTRNPKAITSRRQMGGKTHHEITVEGKVQLSRIALDEANLADLAGIVRVGMMLRSMLGLPSTV